MSKKDTPEETRSPAPGSTMPKWLIPAAVVVIGAVVAAVVLMQKGDGFTMEAKVQAEFTHPTTKAYTQGLEFHKGFLFESTGYTGESDWRIVNLTTSEICHREGISSSLFGEGITILGDKLFQITWRDRKCFVYDFSSFELDKLDPKTISAKDLKGKRPKRVGEFTYDGEGWGLTNDGTHIIMSSGHKDGVIRFRDTSFKVVREITVKDDDGPVAKLNELEYVDGYIYANVYESDTILKIDASDGAVVDKIDCKGLLPEGTKLDPGHVLNGIAHDPATGKFYVTGKNWPKLFEVTFEKK